MGPMSEDVLDTPGAANDGVEGANEQPFRGNSQGMEQVGVNPERIGLPLLCFRRIHLPQRVVATL